MRSLAQPQAFSGSCSSTKPLAACRAAPSRARRPMAVMAKMRPSTDPHLQLGTAKLPPSADAATFTEYMYQWAATLTQSGANYPFALPVKVDKYETGYKIALLKRSPAGNFDAAGEIQSSVEDVSGVGKVMMIRFFEGPAALADRKTAPPADPVKRLESVIDSLIDVDTIMQTMPLALKKALAASKA